MRKILKFILPLIVVGPIGFLILRPGIFNMLLYTIYEEYNIGSNEFGFIIIIDLLILATLYLIVYKLINRILKNER